MKKLKRPFKQAAISTASMPDIIFILLLFFMVTSTPSQKRGIPVTIPKADNSAKIDGKRNVSRCYVDLTGRISADDKLVTDKDLTSLMYMKRTTNPLLVVALLVDQDVKNGDLDKVHKALQDADARRIIYSTKTK